MTMGLTRAQADCLRLIQNYRRERGRYPTFEALRLALGYQNKGAVSRHIDALVERGHLIRTGGRTPVFILASRRSQTHPAPCFCAPCSAEKFANCARFVDALGVEAPRELHGITLVGIKLGHSIPAAADARGHSASGGVAARSAAAGGSHSRVRP